MIRSGALELTGRRVHLRPLTPADFESWREVRRRCRDWLVKWEARPVPGAPDVTEDRRAFAAQCGARDRERQLGTAYGFGIFVEDRFAGAINLTNIQRGSFQNAYIGYWIDEALAGNGYMPESVIVICKFAFEELNLHRLQIAIIPRNANSRRVVEKLEFRHEGVALRYLEINGAWEDHARYAVTAEEWAERGEQLCKAWL